MQADLSPRALGSAAPSSKMGRSRASCIVRPLGLVLGCGVWRGRFGRAQLMWKLNQSEE